MAEISSENVEVVFSDNEVIGSTATDSDQERKFQITNGDKEIIATVMGSEDNMVWSARESKNISADSSDEIDVEINHHIYIKLMVKTTSISDVSIVDAIFTYTPYNP
jgi:hypothetical protein